MDSRSVKTSHHVDSDRGIDGNKKIKGRKEHIIVDTLGLPLAVAVHKASMHDSKVAPQAIEKLAYKFPRLAKILADGGYRGGLADWVKKKFGWILEVVLRPDECPSKFQVLPKRWIVERSFSWLENFRRLTISITNSLLKPQKLWYRLHSSKSCLTDLSNEIKTASKSDLFGLIGLFSFFFERFFHISLHYSFFLVYICRHMNPM
jgi:transposase